MKKDIKKLFLVLILLAFADGIYYNFLELWMQSNGMSISTVSKIISLCSIITVSTVFLCSNIVKNNRLKDFTVLLFGIKAVLLLFLYFLNNTNQSFLIKFIVMIEWALDVEITTAIYPLISNISPSDKYYSLKTLIYNGMYYLGVLAVGNLLGKTIKNITISYNSYVLISALIIIIAGILLYKIDYKKYVKKENDEKNDLINLIKKLKNDKISSIFILFLLFSNISYYTIIGILMTILTSEVGFTPTVASNFNLILGIASVGVGFLILYKLTSKNDYLNISIKFVGRLITFILACLFKTKITILIAIIYAVLFSASYTHITEAPYINRYKGKEQFAFSNLVQILGFLARAIGTYICGIAVLKDIRLNFFLSAIFVIIQLYFGFKAIKLRKEEVNDRQ